VVRSESDVSDSNLPRTLDPGSDPGSIDPHPGDEIERASAALPERFANPGLPIHRHRLADIDPAAARRAERQVAALFGLSALGTLLALTAYFAFQLDHDLPLNDYLSRLQLSNALIGIGIFLALFGIGAGAVHWAKTLMPDDERIDLRHELRGSDEDRAAAVGILKEGAGEAGLGRRPLIRNSLIGALALAPLPAVVFFRDLGPLPGAKLSETIWKEGTPLVRDPQGGKIKASALVQGSIVHVLPEGIEEAEEVLNEKAKAAVILIRLNPDDLDQASLPGSYDGIVAYSKICTHMGCPVALYEQQTQHLLCPCHQSTFDLTKNCKVIFGPAKRPLPQLPITVDAEGYLVAKSEFHEAVGPSFWERG
jgi:ubiquinol-cytochrome c reductase iron-sulfur subunit